MLSTMRYAAVGLLAFASTAAAQSIIYMDYTSGYHTILPNTQITAAYDFTYNTNNAGSYRFGVDWNNDATDQYTINLPSFISITPENSPAFCTPNSTTSPPNQITFLIDTVHQCNYTASWKTPFSGVLTVTYNTGPNTDNSRSNAISTFFSYSPGGVGDPQFVGLRGQSFQVHGIDGAVYNLISGKKLQVNSRFVFLTKGQCPNLDGKAQSDCWAHPGSYLGEMSYQVFVDGKLHSAFVKAGDAKVGFAAVEMDGKAMKVGDKVTVGSFSVEWVSTHQLLVVTEEFDFELNNSDMFINQAVRSNVALSKLHTHGLLGQTHSSKKHASTLKFIEGEVEDYAIDHDDIMGTSFMFNQFEQ